MFYSFLFSITSRHTSCAVVAVVQTCALPIYPKQRPSHHQCRDAQAPGVSLSAGPIPKGARRSPSQKTAFLHYSYMVRFWKSTNQGAEPMPQEILPPPPTVIAPGPRPPPTPTINPSTRPHPLPPQLPFTPTPHTNQTRILIRSANVCTTAPNSKLACPLP